MKKLILIALPLLISGCASKYFEPLYLNKPDIPEMPKLSYLAERNVPALERKQLAFTLFKKMQPSTEDFYNNLETKLQKSRPSVIIGVPDEAGKNSDAKQVSNSRSESEIYRTDGYYNDAEQAIEGALLRKGFNVLDRSKFEAKLRDLRDRANDNRYYWYSNYDKLLENKEYDVVKNMLEEELTSGKITQKDYIERVGDVDKLSQIGLPGKKRTEDEMNDIAEVIRAAQTGEDQADYLLQINKVVVSDAGNQLLFFQEQPEVKDFMNDNPGLSFGDLPSALPSSIASQWLRVDFNAKMIGVKTGSIVWLGSYQLESWAAEPIKISFDVQRKVSNSEMINAAIRKHNAELKNLFNKLEYSNSELNTAYEKAITRKKFDKPYQVDKYKADIQESIESLENKRKGLIQGFENKTNQIPSEASLDWKYFYTVSEPNVQPNLLVEGVSSIAGKQKLLNHRKELIREVTQQLIKTIELK